MTDPAPSAPLDRAASAAPATAPAPRPDLAGLIRAAEWRQALAVSRLGNFPLELQDALLLLQDLQAALRARRYPAARRALAGYCAALVQVPEEWRGQLNAGAGPEALRTGLEALEQMQREPEAAALDTGLAPALAHPFTRAEALNLQGVQRALQGQAQQARALFAQALEADPGHYRALSNIGNLDLEAGDFAAAEARYREVLALNPEYDGGYHNLGVALRRQGKVWEGVQAIKQGQRLNVRQTQAEAKAEAQEQLRQDPRLRAIRGALLALVVLLVVWALFGRGL